MAAQTENNKGKMSSYFRGVKAEMKKVAWPNKKELINHTGIVIGISLIVSIVVYLLDLLIHGVLQLFI
ncbi:MAG: preprotein translocase subunit SecE [Tissierellaceae bacterium]|nr:preprotein translocase subunit SecE [Tissierellaceae bacterium]